MQISHFGALLPDSALLPDGALLPDSAILPDAAAVASSRALSAESPAERQLLRTDFRFAPSLLQRCACGCPLILCCTGSLTLCCIGAPAGQQPHGCLKFCAVPAPPAGNTSWAPQALRCTGAPCRQHLMGASSSALYRRPVPATNLIWRRKVLRFG